VVTSSVPAPLEPVAHPAIGTEVTAEKVRLGRWLFFDQRLSADGRISCGSCHRPEAAFTDPRAISIGVHGRKGRRRSQPLLDLVGAAPYFWDGRAATLVEQVKGPLADPVEMGNHPARLTARIAKIPGYRTAFKETFGDPRISVQRIAEAIASYEATLGANVPPLRDLAPAALEGLELFIHRARCGACHLPPNGFTDNGFHNLGVGWDATRARPGRPAAGFTDTGRYQVTRRESDRGAFKTPMLFSLQRRAPYMHDGSLRTLSEVIDFYDRGGTANPWLSPKLKPLGLTREEKALLLRFLEALEGRPDLDPGPTQFPQ
jgi:cytochrome c peroxidase